MKTRYSKEVLIKIVQQAMFYQCACPALICKAIGQVRELYAYQESCLVRTDTDKAVHERIAATCIQNHRELEQCLEDVLTLEGWNLTTFEIPPNLAKQPNNSPGTTESTLGIPSVSELERPKEKLT